ncbi:MAG TPA: cytochrome C oxidase subunit IV family protein [Rhodocyclaceae bacterium]
MKPGRAESVWLALVALTLAGAWLAETGAEGSALTLTVAALIAVKGRAVIDGYMDLHDASPKIRRVLYAFNALLPLLVVATHWFGGAIARLTALA